MSCFQLVFASCWICITNFHLLFGLIFLQFVANLRKFVRIIRTIFEIISTTDDMLKKRSISTPLMGNYFKNSKKMIENYHLWILIDSVQSAISNNFSHTLLIIVFVSPFSNDVNRKLLCADTKLTNFKIPILKKNQFCKIVFTGILELIRFANSINYWLLMKHGLRITKWV